jgi:hypothetical protein
MTNKIENYDITLLDDSYNGFLELLKKNNQKYAKVLLEKGWDKVAMRPISREISMVIYEALKDKISQDYANTTITEEIEDAQEDKYEELIELIKVALLKDIKEDKAIDYSKDSEEIQSRFDQDDLEKIEDLIERSLKGIKYQHREINLQTMQSPIDANLLSGLPTIRTFNKRKTKMVWEEGMYVLKKKEKADELNPNILANLKIIEDSLTDTKQIMPDSNNKYLSIAIQNNINVLMGQLPQYSKAEKKTIYSYWKDISDKYEDFANKGDILFVKLKQTTGIASKGNIAFAGETAKDKEKMKQKLAGIEGDFEANWEKMKDERLGNYVHQFESIQVVDDPNEETALKILLAYLNKRNAGLILEGEEEEEEEEELDVEHNTMEGSKKLGGHAPISTKEFREIFREVDILSAMYIDAFLGGAIINSVTDKKRIVEILTSHKGSITIPDKDDAELSSFIEELREMEVYEGDAYAPMQILDRKYLSSNFTNDGATKIIRTKENAKVAKNYSNLNDVYLELFDTVADLVTISLGRGATNIHVPTYINMDENDKAKDKARYSQAALSKPTKFKPPIEIDLKTIEANKFATKETKEEAIADAKATNELLSALHNFIQSMEEYIIIPILNTEMNMGIPFEFTNSVGFKTVARYLRKHHSAISVNEKIDVNLSLFTALQTAHEERSGGQATKNDLKIIKGFLLMLSRDFVFGELQKQTFLLSEALFNLANNSELSSEDTDLIQENIESELAAFIGGIATKLDRTNLEDFHGKNPLEEYAKNNVDNVQQVKSFVTIKDFIVANRQGLKAGFFNIVDDIVSLFNKLRKSHEIESKILSAHDNFRIIKGMPVYYGLKSPHCFDAMNASIDSIQNRFGVDITAMEVTYILEEIDSFSNIAKSVGVSEELVYYVKADFR